MSKFIFWHCSQVLTLALVSVCLFAVSWAASEDLPAVGTMRVEVSDVSPRYEFVGRVEAVNAVDIRSRIDGFLESRLFDEGATVGKDQDLFVIERSTYEIALKDAQAALISAQASLLDAERRLQRNQSLSRQTVPQATLEESETARDTARANVMSAEAKVSQAELNLSYTRVKSPIEGRIGQAAFSVGSLVGPSSGALARVVQMDPIRVVFSLSDRSILDLRAAAGGANKDELVKRFIPRLRLSNNQNYEQAGKVEFFGNEIDPQTGTLPIRTLFANPQSLLVPGQFVTVIVGEAQQKLRPVVSFNAIQQDREGRYVLLLDSQGRLDLRRIKVFEQKGSGWVVEEGLKGGETIVVEGLQHVAPGALVRATDVSASVAAAQAVGTSSGSASPPGTSPP
jgi:membrane fusion protein (multidrug efflux system)